MKVTGSRGVMKTIPPDAARRAIVARAFERLLLGEEASASDLFQVQVSGRWYGRLIVRMVSEGAIRPTEKLKYVVENREALLKLQTLLNEQNPDIQKHGYGNTFKMTEDLKALLDGLLLGDGHYSKDNSGELSSAFSMAQREDRISWLEFLQKAFSDAGIKSEITARPACSNVLKNGKTIKGRPSFCLRTATYRTFREQRFRCYPDGVKIVPRDMDFSSPVALAQWHMGDGGFNKQKKAIHLATCGFQWDDVEWVQRQFMEKHGISCIVHNAEHFPALHLYSRNAERFMELVKPHILPCFSYKIGVVWKASACLKCGCAIENRSRRTILCDTCSRPCDLKKRGEPLRPIVPTLVEVVV